MLDTLVLVLVVMLSSSLPQITPFCFLRLEKAFLSESRDCLSKKRLKENDCMSPKTRVS